MEIKNKNRNHEATKDCDKASRGNGLPSARLGWSVSGNIKREAQRRIRAVTAGHRNSQGKRSPAFKWPKFLNLNSESFKNIFKNQKVHQQMNKI